MPCGCTNNKLTDKYGDQFQLRTVSLDTMKNMPIDEIINLYRQGYVLQDTNDDGEIAPIPVYHSQEKPGLLNDHTNQYTDIVKLSPGAYPSIVSGASTGYIGNGTDTWFEFLIDNKASLGYTQGVVKYIGSRYDATASICYQDIPNQLITCIPTTAWNLKTLGRVLVNTGALFNFGCVETFPCTTGEDCTNRTCTTFGSRTSFETQIFVNAYNPSSPAVPTGLTITPGSGTLTISWNSVTDPRGGEVFAYYVNVSTGGNLVVSGYTQSGLRNVTIGGLTNGTTYTIGVIARSYNGIGGSAATGSGTPVGATNPTVFNICWKVGLSTSGQCAIPPDQPPITSGTSFIIKADIANTGPPGKARVVIQDGTTVLSDQNTASLGTYPAGGLWSPYVSFTMPNRNVTLIVNAYGWNGASWILTDTKTSTISMSTPTCTGISLTPFTQSVNTGGTVNFTATTTPSTTQFTVTFKLRDGTVLSSSTTTGGVATYIWTTPSTAGTYYVHAEVGSPVQCTSTESVIQVSAPIVQHNVNITVVDSVTNSPIQGASVTIGTQTLPTNTSGFVTFLVNEGSISVSITKTGYNTYSTTELVYSDITKTYLLVPVTQTTGSLRFITVPTAADVYFADVFGTTLEGTTDPSTGILTIGNLNAGSINYTVKKTGYNDTTGSVTVVGGTTTDVPVTLTTATTTGGVCIKSTPAGASISIDGIAQTGKTTALSTGGCTSSSTITGLSIGNHNYALSLTGYQGVTNSFTIPSGTTINVDVGTLTPISTIGNLAISSSPSGARIYIDNIDSGYVTSANMPNITQGSHTYKLTLTGYKDATGPFNITAGGTTTVPTVTLVQRVGTLKFFSTPVGAAISIGGVPEGVTTATGLVVSNLPIGLTNYTVTLTGYNTYNGTETVIEDVTTSVTITLTPTITGKGSLVIDTTPHGAEISIDGVDKQSTTPHTFTGMDVGGYTYQLQKSGYYTVSGTFAIVAGETTTITKTLQSTGTGTGGAAMLLGVGLATLGIIMTVKPPKPPTKLGKLK